MAGVSGGGLLKGELELASSNDVDGREDAFVNEGGGLYGLADKPSFSFARSAASCTSFERVNCSLACSGGAEGPLTGSKCSIGRP